MEIHQSAFTREQFDAYFASYAGMEGGNPAAAVWFCEFSPGGVGTPLSDSLRPLAQPHAWDEAFRRRHREDMARWQTHQRIARIIAAAREKIRYGRSEGGDWRQYLEEMLYRPCGWEFKLNLFPLAIRPEGRLPWSKLYQGQPELNPKQRYFDLCRDGGRFRFIGGLCRRMRPKVVVCLGERHADDYLKAFGMQGIPAVEHVLKPADQARTLQVYMRQGTTLIVCPAVAGSAGLSSDVLLNALGCFISHWLTHEDFAERADTDGLDARGDMTPAPAPASWTAVRAVVGAPLMACQMSA
ncbi:transcriptional regulator [Cupriavidus basilensis]|uniref:transcriptional regulator n=1 Tax=Cupriavidus basilensis TaxID=68895 RepID=UPI0023E79AE3|nr:transcriptional regulator [Cupriavidus basilensis]MDF3886630.1 transcriptional regulator [Cupriavidus basilensis]